MLSDSQISAVRARFPIFRRAVYLNSCSQGALSDAVESSMHELLETWGRLGSPWDLWVEHYETARREFAAFLGAEPEEVAIAGSVSAGISSLATAFDFHDMGHIWLAQQPRGARVQFLESIEGLPAERYARAIDRDTLIVPVTGISFLNGFRSDVAGIVAAAHEQGAYVLLDDYQDCGTRPRNVKQLGVDFYAAGALKYLLGASGIAFLYVRKDLIPVLQPAVSGWFAQSNPFAFDVRHFDPALSARRFESGTPPIPSVYTAVAGLRLLREIGLENVAEQVRRLTGALIAGAVELGISIKTPADSVGPLVVLEAKDAAALVDRLAKDDILCSSRHDGLRISFHVYNTMDDVAAVLRVLNKNRHLLITEARPVTATD